MPDGQSSNMWLLFALSTVVSWGLYGFMLHTGQVGMADPDNGRYKAFLWVGIAYFLIAVLAPLGFLIANGADWAMPSKGLWWSLGAGVVATGSGAWVFDGTVRGFADGGVVLADDAPLGRSRRSLYLTCISPRSKISCRRWTSSSSDPPGSSASNSGWSSTNRLPLCFTFP